MNQSLKSTIGGADYEVAIIGAGFAGVGAGIRLKMQGDSNFVIFERAAEVGGTWRDNTYPGCACDIPSLLYSYSFEPKPGWTYSFSRQEEILFYLKHCVEKYKITPHIRFQTEIVATQFDETKGHWTLRTKSGETTTARIIISAAGPFNAPYIPNIKGRDSFKGETFHSLTWNHDYNLNGKRVAVVGTGASAIQFIPEITPQVSQLFVFQRTPPWIMPKMDKKLTPKTHRRFKKFPWYQRFWREFIYWFLEHRGKSNFGDLKLRAKRQKLSLEHLHTSVSDSELRKKLTPDYEIGCKRILISDNYYPALQQENVELIAEGAEEITSNGIVTKSGELKEVDAIIYGTGFYTTKFADIFKVIGKDGKNLFEEWNNKGGEAYYGMAVNGFPNFMFMVGPNSGLGHNSIIHMMESQLNYILNYLKHLRKTPTKSTYFEVKKEVQDNFNKDIQQQLSTMVWSDGGCKSYYLQNMDGKNTSIWPGSTVTYRKKTKKINLHDYEII